MPLRCGRAAFLLPGLLLLLSAACSGAEAGTARIASEPPSVGSVTVPSTMPATSGELSSRSPAPSSRASPTDSAASSFSFAQVKFGPPGVPSPTGEVTFRLDIGLICFVPVDAPLGALAGDVGVCAGLPDGEKPRFAVFSPDGASLLVVAGPDEHHGAVYVLDSRTAQMRVIGPGGAVAPSADPPRWDLSSVSWSVDGRSVLLVPRTAGTDGAVLAADALTGRVTEVGRLPADLANGSPNIWSTGRGLALVASAGPDPSSLWWLAADAATPIHLGRFQDAGGSLQLVAADPPGRLIMVCPRDADGRVGEIVAIAVDSGKSTRVLNDSPSCAGAVFSPDGSVVALTATVAGGYSLVMVEVTSGRRLLTVPLPVPEPASSPYLTWKDDTVIAFDATGEWPAPSLIIALH